MSLVLVTGANGNVGREVVRACLASGFEVRAADIAPPNEPDLSFARLDFTDRSTWSAALAGCTFVFLLRPPPLGDMSTTLNPFVDAAFASGVQHLVFLSVSGAESKTWVPHRKVEDHLATTRGAWTVLRPGFFAQNLADAYRLDLLEDDRLYVPAAQGRVAFLDVVDVGDVTARVFSEPERFRGKALRLAGPEAVTFGQLAERVSSVVGRPITYVPASIVGYVWHLWRKRRLPLMQVIVQTVLHVGLRSGEAEPVDDVQAGLLGRPASPLGGYLARTRERWVRRA
ncbi:MAG: NmrA family NAD(P)-binding protein [Myxococcaceae bacterium]|nr:NmrA family NAD(P)-binding protein [Myxococcaceae bacterium]